MINSRQIQVENIQVKIGNKIAKGRQSDVYRGEMVDGSVVAIKVQKSTSEDEKKILQTLKGKAFKYIIQVLAFEEIEEELFIIMELGEKIDLISLPDKRKTCLEMAKGVQEFHQLGYFHRDLKLINYVVGKDKKIKLTDFGIAKTITKESNIINNGTMIYMAPEMFVNKYYDSTIDIWSLGMIFYEIFNNQPFFELNEVHKLIEECIGITQQQINKKIKESKKNVSEVWQSKLLQKMIVQRLDNERKLDLSRQRISIDEVVQELEQLNDLEQFQFERKEDLNEILISLKDIDSKAFIAIIEMLRNQKSLDILEFLSKQEYQQHLAQLGQYNVNKIRNAIINISQHIFNKNDYSHETYQQIRQQLHSNISKEEKIVDFLKFLVHLTAIDRQFIQSGSNSLNLLVEMKADLNNQSWEEIRIKDTSLIGGTFVRCNFNGSEFDGVDVSGMNLNGAQLFNCKWRKIKIHELSQIDGHTQKVYSVCFSPDGNILTSGSRGNSISLWDVRTGQQKNKLEGHTSAVYSVCFSPDGKTLASGSKDKTIRLWDVKTGQQKNKLEGHTSAVYSVCFSPDGNTLASGSKDKTIRLWDVKTKKLMYKLDGHSDFINSVCFSPDGSTLASGSKDKTICLWDVKTKKLMYKIDGHRDIVNSVCFSPDGNTLASGSKDETIRLWDVKTKKLLHKLDHHDYVNSVCFSPDGNTLASGSDDKSIDLWDVKTGQQKNKFNGHNDPVNSVCFSPDGNTLASGCKANFLRFFHSGNRDNTIRLWDIKTGLQKHKLDGHPNSVDFVCFSPDGNTVASGSHDSIRLWDVKTGQQKIKLDVDTVIIRSICFFPDGNTLATGFNNSICFWDVKTGKQKKELTIRRSFDSICFSPDGNTIAGGNDKSIELWDVKTRQQKNILNCHTKTVYSLCFSLDGNTLASSSDNSIRFWDVKTGFLKNKIDGHIGSIRSVCFSPDGNTLASGHSGPILLWDVKTGKQKYKLDGHTNFLQSVCFSPDGNTLASGSADNSIGLWDVKTGQQINKLDEHSETVYSVCFSPDGNTLASSSYDKSIRLWDVKTGQQKNNLDGHSVSVYSFCFSPDRNTLASVNQDNSILLWDVKTGQQKNKLCGHDNQVKLVCFSPDGNTLASCSDNSICLWDVQTGQQKTMLDCQTIDSNTVCFSPDQKTLAFCDQDNTILLWDFQIGQYIAKMNCFIKVRSLRFSSDGTILAYYVLNSDEAENDNENIDQDVNAGDNYEYGDQDVDENNFFLVHLRDVKTGQSIEPTDKRCKDNLDQFLTPLSQHNQFAKMNQNLNILHISQQAIFQAKGALIFKSSFVNQTGIDLKTLFQQKGSCILDDYQKN
ncbi:unnamed protein product [Paramecium sonneborni]|uniref:Protein kinase domain-containing protein n=1 Tax=Paramecium sonneborni TaxID=65129 RepID=A0A8S1QPM9_9CILI|nr:unnamed protein product [Paramecium sonneborni]